MCKGVADWEARCKALNDRLDEEDLSGFRSVIFDERYGAAAEAARDADSVNYGKDPIYLQSEYDALNGLISKDDETAA